MSSDKKGIQSLAQSRGSIYHIDPYDLVVDPEFNCRDFEDPEVKEHIRRLKISISEHGVLEPLTVHMKQGEAVLTNGECRLRAVRELMADGLEIKSVPVQTEARTSNEAERVSSQITRNGGRPFSPMEQCKLFHKLRKYGWAELQIANTAGLTVERIRQIMALNLATEKVREAIRQRQISPTTAQKIIIECDGDESVAEERILEGVKLAQAKGATKASPKHFKELAAREEHARRTNGAAPLPKSGKAPPVNTRALLKEIISYADPDPRPCEDGDESHEVITLVVPTGRFETIVRCL